LPVLRARALPTLRQLSLLAHGGYVVARIADRAQRAAIFGREGPVSVLDSYSGRNNTDER
jgi:hypothetical protein